MSFLTTLALAVALFVVAPYFAHRLRRRRAEEQPFAPARLVDPAPPEVRRRAKLEDRALFAVRVVAIVLLAVLGATPLVRCSRLSLQRQGGASFAMALVVDDSMSMSADAQGAPRFERARQAARELLASSREGDAVAVVLAGSPARVALAATTDLSAVRAAIDSMSPSHRATDLDGALVLATSLVSSLPQVDRRVVVLSDLADGHPDGPPLGEGGAVPVWVALPELRAERVDCAVVQADRRGLRVRVSVSCGPGQSALGRDVVVEDAKRKVLGRAAVGPGRAVEVTVLLPSADAAPVDARLSGADAIAADDEAPVVTEAGRGTIAVVVDSADEAVATGGAPVVEQALASLKLDLDVRPIPAFPDRVDDLAGDLGILLDDPSGLTPEQRHAMSSFFDGRGVVMLALGPRAAHAPLGATLEPVLTHAVAWRETTVSGADPQSASGLLAESAASVGDLGASHRAGLAPADAAAFEPLLRWADGATLVGRRAVGRGEAWVVGLPFSVEASDLALRPGFLALLEAWTRTVRDRAVSKRSVVGVAWTFPGPRDVSATGPTGAVPVSRDGGVPRVVPPVLGLYRIVVDGKVEERVAAPDVRELDLRPRPIAGRAAGHGVGERRAAVDVSGYVSLLLLAVFAFELMLRVAAGRRAAPTGWGAL